MWFSHTSNTLFINHSCTTCTVYSHQINTTQLALCHAKPKIIIFKTCDKPKIHISRNLLGLPWWWTALNPKGLLVFHQKRVEVWLQFKAKFISNTTYFEVHNKYSTQHAVSLISLMLHSNALIKSMGRKVTGEYGGIKIPRSSSKAGDLRRKQNIFSTYDNRQRFYTVTNGSVQTRKNHLYIPAKRSIQTNCSKSHP